VHKIIGLDFETYAVTDLLECGLDNYVKCEWFTVLLAAVAMENEYGDVVVDVIDFRQDYARARERLAAYLDTAQWIAAHNAGFEEAVLDRLHLSQPASKFLDTAVMARAAGAAGKLEAAAPQLLGVDKVETGYDLIKLFSIPGEYQARVMKGDFDDQIIEDNPNKWLEFRYYCGVDAELSLRLAMLLDKDFSDKERANTAVTMDMNAAGWHVDMGLVDAMQYRYDCNVEKTVADFRKKCDEPDLNLSSFPQLKEWCEKRGVKATSFDEQAVAKLIATLTTRMASKPDMDEATKAGYQDVLHMLYTKQILGGSSLKKLLTISNRVSDDSRLRDSYLHIGAGATYRTSGRGVQMQNLPRLHGKGDDVGDVHTWTNDLMAHNLRQVFTAGVPGGRLIVGDFSSVESRGLAWLSGEDWKLQAYLDGRGIYEELAAKKFGVKASAVSKEQRTFGKVGELSCGYGAGAVAVKEFAEKMGVMLSEDESRDLVYGWRDACPKTQLLWERLDEAIRQATLGNPSIIGLPHGDLKFTQIPAPKSLRDQAKLLTQTSVRIDLYLHGMDRPYFTRVIHGLYRRGKNICYFKPSERKTGDLWSPSFVNPKTKQRQFYSVYGGKLAGLMTQSLCREIFFDALRVVHDWVGKHDNLMLVGQFHDEIVVEWAPDPVMDLPRAERELTQLMSMTVLSGFPLTAEIKSAYRYIK
jgi:DNA polymerase